MFNEAGHELGGVAERAVVVEAERLQVLAHQNGLVCLIQQGEVGAKANVQGVIPQDALAEAVERAHPQIHVAHGQQLVHALLHFAGGLVGEREGQDVVGLDFLVANEPGNALSNDRGLARPRASNDKERAGRMRNRLFLSVIQRWQKGHAPSLPAESIVLQSILGYLKLLLLENLNFCAKWKK